MSVETSSDDARADRRENQPDRQSFWSSPAGWVALGFIGVAGYFLITEHAAHLFGVLPWLLILSCPLMHLFMHHGGHGHSRPATPTEKKP